MDSSDDSDDELEIKLSLTWPGRPIVLKSRIYNSETLSVRFYFNGLGENEACYFDMIT